jgi:hypothetical protein
LTVDFLAFDFSAFAMRYQLDKGNMGSNQASDYATAAAQW